MSRIDDALRRVEVQQRGLQADRERAPSGMRVLAVCSNKGGVGKTCIATNLAVYLRALREDLPILIIGLDEQTMVDRMFEVDTQPGAETTASCLRRGSFSEAIRLGQYGVHFVPASRDIYKLKQKIYDPFHLQRVLSATGWRGVVIIDTKSDFEILTLNALAASDLSIVVVKDHASLIEARRVFDLFEEWKRPRARARILLSLVDLRIKYRDGDDKDILSLLLSEIRRRRYPLFETFISRSPKIESLYTNPEGRAISILHGAPGSLVHRQMHHLAQDVFASLFPEDASVDAESEVVEQVEPLELAGEARVTSRSGSGTTSVG